MQQRTWPYGTVKKVRVTHTDTGRYKGQPIRVIIVHDPVEKEAYILVGDKSNAEKDDEGYIEFTKGGPTGGFWVFTKEQPIAAAG